MDKKSTKKKNSQLLIRINDQERAAFIDLCEDLDTSAARETRRFIREFIASHGKKTGKRQ
ncbi:MAG: transcription elongation GreA/GreB family factor [Paraglaciecola sp.]